ncbi:MAG: hypothetical protein AAF203_01815 [Pseudomonadota bacterium]
MGSVIRVFSSVALVLCLGVSFAHAEENTKSKAKIEKIKKKAKKKKKGGVEDNAALASFTGGSGGFRFIGSLTHVPKLRNDQEDTSEIFLATDYTLNKKHRFRLQQFFTKFYSKFESEHEFKPTDTQIAHFYTPDFKPFGARLMWRTGVALPISNESARDDLITRFTGSLIASKMFFKNKLMVFAVPYARYHWYEFKTSVSGRPLPWYTAGMSTSLIYFLSPKLSVSGTGNYNYEWVRNSQFDQDQDQIANGIYRFDLSVAYQFTPEFSASLGYFQGANYMQDGRYEVVFFDDQESRYSLGVTAIF